MESDERREVEDAIDEAVANAALEGIRVEDDEQDLIRRHQHGELSRDEFLAAARELAQRKAEQGS
jgi:hypothetical protein